MATGIYNGIDGGGPVPRIFLSLSAVFLGAFIAVSPDLRRRKTSSIPAPFQYRIVIAILLLVISLVLIEFQF